MKPNSDHALEFVDDFLHGVLSADEAERLEQHCDGCSICQAALQAARQRSAAMQTLPMIEASESLVIATDKYIENVGTRRERNWRVVRNTMALATAACVLLIGGVHAYYATLKPTPYDLRLLGQSHWLPDSPAAIRLGVFDQTTGAPLSGVTGAVELVGQDAQVHLAKFTTGDDGTAAAEFHLPDWPDGEYQLTVTALPDGDEETLTESVRLRRAWKLMLSTDKPVYKPGDIIHLRALGLRRPDLKPVAGQNAEFRITDPKGNVIFKRADVTSRFGIVAADCPLATELIEGDYTIACRIGDTRSERTVKVERYVLPKFRVDVQPSEPFYQPGQLVMGEVDCNYFFGEPVRGAKIALTAKAMEIGERTLYETELTADDMGRAEFRFALPQRLIGREQESGAARVRLTATVTDTAGQRAAGSATRLVANEPIRVTVVPESSTLAPNVPNRIYILTTQFDGTPLATRLVVSGREDELTTNDDGLARIEVTPTGNRLELSVKATDAEGRTGRASFAHNVASPNTAFLLRPDKAVYDGGETMKLSIVGGGIEPVLIDLLKDGQAILSTTVAMQDGQGELAVDLPAELFGTLQLIAYRYGQSGLPVRQSRVIFVRPADELTVQATLDRDVYEPGGKATVRFELRNEQGQPVAGALSVAAVDEAVFSVLGPQLGLERTFFELESELLQPVATVYPWSPFDAEQSPARTELAQALFARTVDVATGDQAVPGRFRDGQAKGVRSVDPLRDGGDAPIFTLVANTFPAKDRVTDIQRRRGLRWAAAAWRWSAAGFILACIGIFAAYRPRLFAIIASVALLLILPLGCMTWMFLRLDAQFDFAAGDMAITAEAANEEMPYPLTEDMAAGDESAQSGRPQPRVREWFPETLVWRPELVTDDNGVATLEIDPLADSITTWRLSASAISAGGRLGSLQQGIRVFQPFFVDVDLPVAFTRGDEVSMPIVVYNYLDEPQTVELALDAADWYERLDADDAQTQPLRIELAAGEVRSLHVPLRMLSVGQHRLTVTARGGETADAIRREVTVEPNGKRYESLFNGTLDSPFETTIQIPDNAVPGSAQVFAKFYPSTFSQLVEGLDGIFAQPHGCFEQTSSTTYPNVLALDYLRRARQAAPEVEAQARQYIHLGYQRLLTFEVDGGGFDWFGNPPAHTQLTAYGLMEFEDMANVHDIDPTLIQRTRGWLLAMRNSDGSWPARRGLDEVGGDDTLANTAYIAWAVFGGESSAASGSKASTLQYLLAHEPATLGNPYHLAVMANALQAIGAAPSVVNGYVERLLELSQTSLDGKQTWWPLEDRQSTLFHGRGPAGTVETTAMAALALMKSGDHVGTVRGTLRWLVANKNEHGTWGSTQATVLALKALIDASEGVLADAQPREIEIVGNGNPIRTLTIPVDQFDVVRQEELTSLLDGETRLTIRELTETGTAYQFLVRYHLEPEATVLTPGDADNPKASLAITIDYDRTRLSVDDHVTAVAQVTNRLPVAAPMVMVDLPIPPGFAIDPGELEELLGSRTIAKYELTPRQAILYLRQLNPNQSLTLRYRLRATMPVKVTAPAAQTYLYYSPTDKAQSEPRQLEVTET